MVAMKTTNVARAMVEFFRVGIPREILTDQGSNFMSEVMRQVYELLDVKHVVTSVYHPQTNAIVERFNGTLKAVFRRLCADTEARDWDDYVPFACFAYRDSPHEHLGFSPFELV